MGGFGNGKVDNDDACAGGEGEAVEFGGHGEEDFGIIVMEDFDSLIKAGLWFLGVLLRGRFA